MYPCANLTTYNENSTLPPCNAFPPNVPPIDFTKKIPIENIILYVFLCLLSLLSTVLVVYIGKSRRSGNRSQNVEETTV